MRILVHFNWFISKPKLYFCNGIFDEYVCHKSIDHYKCIYTVLYYLIKSEVYPTALRATGFSACNILFRIGNTITPILSQQFLSVGIYYPYMSYGITFFIGGIAALFLPIETTGRALQDEVSEDNNKSIDELNRINEIDKIQNEPLINRNE
jgi:hypothetical protein